MESTAVFEYVGKLCGGISRIVVVLCHILIAEEILTPPRLRGEYSNVVVYELG